MRTTGRLLLGLSLTVNLLGAAAAGAYVQHRGMDALAQKLRLQERPGVDFRVLAAQRFGALPGASTAFIGDSHVELAPLAELVGPVAQRGLGGQTIADVASWIEQVLSDAQLRRLVVWCGTNDILSQRSGTQVDTAMRQLLGHVRQQRPDVSVAVLTVPPMPTYSESVLAANQAIRAASLAHGAAVLDLTDALSAPGVFAEDGVHLTSVGYRAVRLALRQAASG